MKRVISIRKQCPEFGYGEFRILDSGSPHVFAHACTWKGNTVIAVHNFADKKTPAKLKLNAEATSVIDLLGDQEYKPVEDGIHGLEIDRYGFRWLRLKNK